MVLTILLIKIDEKVSSESWFWVFLTILRGEYSSDYEEKRSLKKIMKHQIK